MGKEDKTFFDKKIVYLDYLERGEKIKNGGFVKWDVRGEDCRIQIHIRGLYTTDTMQGEIKLISRDETYRADAIGLQYGTGEYASRWKNDDLAGTGISYAECDGILIRLSDTRVLKGQWRERAKEEEPEFPKMFPAEREETEQPEAEMQETSEATEVVEAIEAAEAKLPEEVTETFEVADTAETTETIETTETTETTESEAVKAANYPLSLNKWEQLERIYPKIHPFGDSREYLSVTPRDFVVLPRQYQELVQNSFLLHGYYNYGHLILTKIVEAEEERYYLGVPGVYYDREKQAALMFGFEGFEAGTDKMEDGGFGYYMKRVEI